MLHLCYVLCSSIFFCVFFFKQKTAYEMRISDWSSDVCSSDLRGVVEGAVLHDHADRLDRLQVLGRIARDQEEVGELALLDGPHALVLAEVARAVQQIGRASCRERVCQYV